MAPKIERNKVLIKDASGRVVKVIYYYYPPIQQKNEKTGEMETVSIDLNNITRASRVEIDFTYEGQAEVHSSEVIKDYSPDGVEYVETRLVYGKEIRDIARCTQAELPLIIDNYSRTAEVAGHRVTENLPDGRVVVEFTLKVPQIESRRVATDGSYAEKLLTPLCIIYDKAITEDMGTTYKQEQQGFEMAITPFDVGRGMAPAQGASLVKQHYRWTDGQRC